MPSRSRLIVVAFAALSLLISVQLFAQASTPAQSTAQSQLVSAKPHGITETLAYYSEKAIRAIGYAGLYAAMTAESMVLPVPAEAVMPFAGFLVAEGTFSPFLVILFSVLGSLSGSLISYGIGAWGGKPFVRRFGKYVLLDQRDLDATERYFERRGTITIFFSRFIPVVRHLISIPAGVARMHLVPFIILTALGAGSWNTFLMLIGRSLREHWSVVQRYSHIIDVLVVVLLVLAIFWYVYRHLRRRSEARSGAANQ